MEVQFSWIFILVVGGLILLFFVAMVNSQRDSADTKFSATLARRLQSIMTGVEVSAGTAHEIAIPKTKILVDCNSFSIGKTSRVFKNRILYSPDLIKGRELFTWTVRWSAPFPVTNLVMMTSSDVIYVFVNSSGLPFEEYPQQLYEELPDNITKRIVSRASDLQDIDFSNYYKVKMVFIDDPGSEAAYVTGIPEVDVKAIKIEPQATYGGTMERSYGQIRFYRKRSGSFVLEDAAEPSLPYVGLAMMAGAVFAEGEEMYGCSLAKASSRLDLGILLTMDRASGLRKLLHFANLEPGSPLSGCVYYSLMNLEIMHDNSDLSDLVAFGNAAQELYRQNEVLEEYSCPLIY